MINKRGRFFCIEGLDASGKTTHARQLVRDLRKKGFDAIYTTEPSPDKIGEFTRAYVLQRKRRVPIAVEALLFAADRVNHVETWIKPALQKGRIVICDRYVYSSLAYQGAAGLDLEWIKEVNRNAITPDLAIYLAIPPEAVVERITWRKSVMEKLQIQRRVQEIYKRLLEDGLLVQVEGDRPKDEVSKDILAVALDSLKS
ncbi:MAG: dTMP kinase [Candidatus Bathyarchaeota archaeon]|nr:MAG: dTMP kinase [Candidatus Bathyarchaeota archaeon]